MSAAAATPPARNFVIAVMPLSSIRAAGKRMAARSCSLSLRRWTVAEPAVGQRSFASSLPHQPAKQAVEIGRKLTIARVKEPLGNALPSGTSDLIGGIAQLAGSTFIGAANPSLTAVKTPCLSGSCEN